MTTGEVLIRGGNIVDPASNLFWKGDLLIRGDKIARVSLTDYKFRLEMFPFK